MSRFTWILTFVGMTVGGDLAQVSAIRVSSALVQTRLKRFRVVTQITYAVCKLQKTG